ncbi:hypothetical protein KSP40_PGU004175 [Platanthera guangdongensis]|uniref:Uncharacterized protein n=1 Tax=Platanthera guangdongensis TaxID=2320717 RepID=A0ABR2MG07_9ASPA
MMRSMDTRLRNADALLHHIKNPTSVFLPQPVSLPVPPPSLFVLSPSAPPADVPPLLEVIALPPSHVVAVPPHLGPPLSDIMAAFPPALAPPATALPTPTANQTTGRTPEEESRWPICSWADGNTRGRNPRRRLLEEERLDRGGRRQKSCWRRGGRERSTANGEREQDLSFIVNLEKRIQNATELLDHSLGNCLKEGLEHHDEDAIYNCLRAYAAIDNTAAAEEIFRTVIVAPLFQKIISFDQPHIIDGTSTVELEEYYKEIKQCIKSDCKFILDISSIENSGFHVFDFLANSILRQVLLDIQKWKPGAFSPGRPAEFIKNYKSSLEFLGYLEGSITKYGCNQTTLQSDD